MKKFLKKLGIALFVALFTAMVSQAQFVPGPALFNAVANAVYTNAFTVASAATTNLPLAVARIVNIGPNGFGVQVYCTAAGTSLATNTLAFEQSMDGSNFVNTLPLIAVFVTNNTVTAVTYNTNILNTTPSIGPNTRAVRLKYITNSIAQIGYYTNILISTGR
jgi:hypothetical protein